MMYTILLILVLVTQLVGLTYSMKHRHLRVAAYKAAKMPRPHLANGTTPSARFTPAQGVKQVQP